MYSYQLIVDLVHRRSDTSFVDSWLLLRNVESNGERNRLLFIIKSRGSAHSNQVREFLLTDEGPQLVDVYVGPEGVLTGSARIEHMERDRRARASGESSDQRSPEADFRDSLARGRTAAQGGGAGA